MTPERGRLLNELLEEVMNGDKRKPGRLWIPPEAFLSFQRLTRLPFNEIIVPRRYESEWKFLWTRRDPGDPEWHNEEWHIPGTRWDPWRWNKEESELAPGEERRGIAISQAEACERGGEDEFGVPVDFAAEIGTRTWHFDYRYPISHLSLCFERPGCPIVETDRRRFFSPDEPPEPRVPLHEDFIRDAEKVLRTWKIVVRLPQAFVSTSNVEDVVPAER